MGTPVIPPLTQQVLDRLREIASGQRNFEVPSDRVVYQSYDVDKIERIEPDGRRTVGRFVNRIFVEDVPPPRARRR